MTDFQSELCPTVSYSRTHSHTDCGELLLDCADNPQAALHRHHQVLWPPPAGKAAEASCPGTQQQRRMERESNQQPTDGGMNSSHRPLLPP